MSARKTIGQIGYEAFALSAGPTLLLTGRQYPPWDELGNCYRAAWEAAAEKIEEICKEEPDL